eukprot:scpid91735/ scgid10829/ 
MILVHLQSPAVAQTHKFTASDKQTPTNGRELVQRLTREGCPPLNASLKTESHHPQHSVRHREQSSVEGSSFDDCKTTRDDSRACRTEHFTLAVTSRAVDLGGSCAPKKETQRLQTQN